MPNVFQILADAIVKQNLQLGATPTELRERAFKETVTVSQPVNSSAVDRLGYDENTRVLNVEFQDGSAYMYFNVPPVTADAIINASSVGEVLNDRVRWAFIPFTKVR
jgi:hypothetical protein